MPPVTVFTIIRNPINCRACDALLLAESLCDDGESRQVGSFSFNCPVCSCSNEDVPLHGQFILKVIADPRKLPRTGGGPSNRREVSSLEVSRRSVFHPAPGASVSETRKPLRSAAPPVDPNATHRDVAGSPPTFPMTCPTCHSEAGIALHATVGRKHGTVDVLVHCGSCHHEWPVELPKHR